MNGYDTKPFPRNRKLVVDAGWNGRRKHMIHGLIEVDVTEPRRFLREYKAQTGESLSFTAFVLACLGQAVGEVNGATKNRGYHQQSIVQWQHRSPRARGAASSRRT